MGLACVIVGIYMWNSEMTRCDDYAASELENSDFPANVTSTSLTRAGSPHEQDTDKLNPGATHPHFDQNNSKIRKDDHNTNRQSSAISDENWPLSFPRPKYKAMNESNTTVGYGPFHCRRQGWNMKIANKDFMRG